MSDQEEHPRADEALDWVLGNGTTEQRRSFEEALSGDPELAKLSEEMGEGAAILAMSCEQFQPRSELLDELMGRIGEAPVAELPEESAPSPEEPPVYVVPKATVPKPAERKGRSGRGRWREILAWAAVITLAVTSAWLWKEKQRVESDFSAANERVRHLANELETARESRDLARIEVETLKATIDEYREGIALVVWDQDKQEGVLKLEKMPPIPVDKDYQLWVVDPDHENPVDAGVVRVDGNGFARVKFKPTDTVSAQKFAISVEQRGGVPINQGPIVLLSP
ncbi:MAG: anti-sigma factor [Verrucomicrobiae bacterium]|nr:anti-sigma factor [Verrucomicrobiae bacterium]